MSDGEAAYRRAAQGDFSDLPETISALGTGDAVSRAWSHACAMLLAATVPSRPARVSPHDVGAETRLPAATLPLALAARQGVLSAVLAFDAERLDAWAKAAQACAAGSGADARAIAAIAAGWVAIARGEPLARARVVLPELGALRAAAPAADPGLAVEGQVLRALDRLAAGATDEALGLARHASRMAASEGVLQQEYLAALVLARARRFRGQGHRAVRILSSLARVVPSPWRRWVAWEIAFAGAGGALEPFARAARAGDPTGASDVLTAAAVELERFAPLRDDLATVTPLIDPLAAPAPGSDAWLRGATDDLPRGLRNPDGDARGTAFVVVAPGRPARRVLACAVGLAAPGVAVPVAGPGEGDEAGATGGGTRLQEAAAILALAGPEGIAAADLFRTVYRFAMEDTTHDEVLRGLLHRVREDLGDLASIIRRDAHLVYEPHRLAVLADPRCEATLADRIVGFLARANGRATAREIAGALRIPLRTVQRTLGHLVEDGACTAEPDGRRVEYVVEDTTFHEPTLHRLRGKGTEEG